MQRTALQNFFFGGPSSENHEEYMRKQLYRPAKGYKNVER
jgi:hypothetical protein